MQAEEARDLSLRVKAFFDKAELTPPPTIPSLAKPSAPDFGHSLSINDAEAKLLLAQQRISERDHRIQERQLHHRWSVVRLKDSFSQAKGSFTKHEVAKAFDSLLSGASLASPGIAQALLNHASISSLSDLWSHFHDAGLEKRTASRYRLSKSIVVPAITWLDRVTYQRNVEYIRLLCNAGVEQTVLDRAFKIALDLNSMEAMEVLLAYGAAVASALKDDIRRHFKLHYDDLAKLLLSAPNALSVEDWRYCMDFEDLTSPSILVMSLSRFPALASRQLLHKALRAEKIEIVALILAHKRSDPDLRNFHVESCRIACLITNHGIKCKIFTMFVISGWLDVAKKTEFLSQELSKAVIAHQLDLIRILTDSGIVIEASTLSYAISSMDLDVLELLKDGEFSSSFLDALRDVPDSVSENDMLKVLHIFRHRVGSADEQLHGQLIRAVQKRHSKVVQVLLEYGASVELQKGSALRRAIQGEDFEILSILLQHQCSPSILSDVVPTAMAMKSRPSRLQAMRALLNKSLMPHALCVSLYSLVKETGEIDVELIELLLQSKACVICAFSESKNEKLGGVNNCIVAAIRRGNLPVLAMLCDAEPQKEALSRAIHTAILQITALGYHVARSMVKLLLEKGAPVGALINVALVAAASQDVHLGILCDLLDHGADANYDDGCSFTIALERKDLKVLELLCQKCSPTQASIESVLSTAIDERWYIQDALQILLSSSSASAAALNSWWPKHTTADPKWTNLSNIIPCFLRHGLDVNAGGGSLLGFAIKDANVPLLKKILASNPSVLTLRKAFRLAFDLSTSKSRLEIMELLLQQAKSDEIGQSEYLWQLVVAALPGHIKALELFLRHQAAVDFEDGRALQTAASAGCSPVLDLLLSYRPSVSSIKNACLAVAFSTLASERKRKVFERLLGANAGASAQEMSDLLTASVTRYPKYTQLPLLLLEHGVEPQLETLKAGLEDCPHSLYKALLHEIKSPNTAVEVFKRTRRSSIDSRRRYLVYRSLISKGIPVEELSIALLACLKGFHSPLVDLDVVKLLLEHGAVVGCEGGKAFRLALLGAHSGEAFKLLTQYLQDDGTAGIAFDLARKHAFSDPQQRTDIYRSLLQHRRISKSHLDEALEDFLKGDHSDNGLVQLLLRKGADPNRNNARCFILACIADAEPEFRALSRYSKPDVVVQALIAHFEVEGQVVRWFNICLEERTEEAKLLDQDGLLFLCLRKFPNGTALLRLLLDTGVSASTKATYQLCPDQEPEECTALVWALFAKEPRIEINVILTLLYRAGREALPAYSTPVMGLSAAFGCLLDSSRTLVLEALLKLDKKRVLSCEIPARSFGYFSASSDVSEEESSELPDPLSLYWASLYLGNFDAFRLVSKKNVPDDGLLHTAALLALPKLVKWLLKTHDANCKEEEFDQRIPLAVVCDAKPIPWSKIANEDSDFQTRQSKTMKLLAAKSNPEWRYRGKTVLHIALENGIETTNAMVKALRTKSDPKRKEKYGYTDREGKAYSPYEYVMEFVDGSAREKSALVDCLEKGGFKNPTSGDLLHIRPSSPHQKPRVIVRSHSAP